MLLVIKIFLGTRKLTSQIVVWTFLTSSWLLRSSVLFIYYLKKCKYSFSLIVLENVIIIKKL